MASVEWSDPGVSETVDDSAAEDSLDRAIAVVLQQEKEEAALSIESEAEKRSCHCAMLGQDIGCNSVHVVADLGDVAGVVADDDGSDVSIDSDVVGD